MAESEYKNFALEFVDETKWGFILDEIIKHGIAHLFLEDKETRNIRHSIIRLLLPKYAQFNWKATSNILFQSPSGKNMFSDLGKRRGGSKSNRLRNAHLRDASFVFAKTKILAFARLFVEFEEDREKLLEMGMFSQYSGYNILRILFKIGKPTDLLLIMKELGYKSSQWAPKDLEDFRKRRMVKLEAAGLVFGKAGTYLLSPEIAQAFYYAEKTKSEILSWPYRDNWFLPLRK